MAWNMVLTYLHFKILKFPLTLLKWIRKGPRDTKLIIGIIGICYDLP